MTHRFLLVFALALPFGGCASDDTPNEAPRDTIRLLRNATLVVQIGDQTILVDPMFAPKGAYDPFPGVTNQTRNPLVDLPITQEELQSIIDEVDAVLITHTHLDHWDPDAQQLILNAQQSRNIPIYTQPEDAMLIRDQGLADVQPIQDAITWEGITIHRTGGQHGLGALGVALGPVSGYVLDTGVHRIYIAGDTVWSDEVRTALNTHKPNLTVLNAGGAEFETGPLAGGPITMTPEDVISVYNHAPDTQIVTVHMDTLNHCHVLRTDLTDDLTSQGLLEVVEIPADGQVIKVDTAL